MSWVPAVAVMSPAMGSGATLAATEISPTSPLAVVIYVLGGVLAPTTIAWMFIKGQLHSDSEFRRVIAESERRRQDNETLRESATTSLVPLVQRSTSVLEDVVALLRNELRMAPPSRSRSPRRGQSDETSPPP